MKHGLDRRKEVGTRSTLLMVMILCLIGVGAKAQDKNPQRPDVDVNSLNDLNQAERDVRDPFWPVGYYPEWWRQVQTEEPEEVKLDAWVEARRLIRVSGMSKMGNSGYFAVINGKTVTAGEIVSVQYDGKTYRWTVADIGKKGVKLTRIED